MRLTRLKFIIFALLGLLVIPSCGSRMPSPQTAHKIMAKSFSKYGKKYKTSDFGQHPVEKVEVSAIHELQKNLAEVEGLVHLDGGSTYRVRVTVKKSPFGWKYLAWENLTGREK